MMTYQEQLRHPLWQKRKAEIFSRDNWACTMCCETTEQLHCHHTTYHREMLLWEYPDCELVTLCRTCHNTVTQVKDALGSYLHLQDYWDAARIMLRLFNSGEGRFVAGLMAEAAASRLQIPTELALQWSPGDVQLTN